MLKRVQRYDRGRLSRAGTTPTGGARVRANISRTGIQAYRMPDGSVRREYRPAEEVFHPDSLASFRGAAVTIGHPDKVGPSTWSKETVGIVSALPERVKLHDGQEYAATDVDVNRADALEKVDAGELEELSAGYSADFDPTPGRDPVTGEAYDGVQRNIRLNHVALLGYGKARAGRNARLLTDESNAELRLDSDGNQYFDTERPEQLRMKFILNGKEYEAGPELQAAIGALESEAKTQKDRADKADAAAATASAKADKAESDRKDAADKFDAAVASEIEFRSKVAPVLDEKDKRFDFAGKSRRDVQLAVVKKLRPAKEFAKDASDITIGSYFDVVIEDWKPEAEPKKGESYVAPKASAVADEDKMYLDEAAWAEHMANVGREPKKG